MLRKALLTVTGVLAAVCTGLFVSQGVTNVHADNGDDTLKVIEYTLDDEEYRAKLDKMQKELEENREKEQSLSAALEKSRLALAETRQKESFSKENLDRIQSLGVNWIYLLPVHPTGEVHRKGSLGSPYAIKDYRAIDPLLGGNVNDQPENQNIRDRRSEFLEFKSLLISRKGKGHQ